MSKLKIDYVDHYVAFLDVLGFKEMINSNQVDRIEAFFDEVAEWQDKLKKKSFVIKTHITSDSIIAAIESHDGIDSLKRLALFVMNIQYRLAKKNIWLRGAISRGKFFFSPKGDVVVGKALTEAYLMEKQAKHPRVLLSPAILSNLDIDRADFASQLEIDGTKMVFDFVHSDVVIDSLFLDYVGFGLTKIPSENMDNDLEAIYRSVRSCLYSSQDVFEKFNWVKTYIVGVLVALTHRPLEVPDLSFHSRWIHRFSAL